MERSIVGVIDWEFTGGVYTEESFGRWFVDCMTVIVFIEECWRVVR